MPIVVPPFVQYQSPLPPLRGLWNATPTEGDRFVSAEIDWGLTVPLGMGVQFSLSGNSPLAFSQIVAFQVDNTRNAADVSFLFPDSGYTLVVPAYCQGTFPVFTNALMFYAASATAVSGDRTVFQVLNSMPPPVAVQESAIQENNGLAGIDLTVDTSVQVVPLGVNGTLEYIFLSLAGEGTGAAQVNLLDGNTPPKEIFVTSTIANTTGQPVYINVGPIRVGFVNGIIIQISGTSLSTGLAIVNLYYGVP